MERGIQELFELVAPSRFVIDTESVATVCENLGMKLPEDYVQIGLSYGFGAFHGGGARLHYYDAALDGYSDYVLNELDAWKDHCRALEINDLLFYPSEGGMLPMGFFDNGLRLAFLCSGAPQDWSIMLFESLEEDDRHVFHCNSCEFLIRTMTGELRPLLGFEEGDYSREDEVVQFISYAQKGGRRNYVDW